MRRRSLLVTWSSVAAFSCLVVAFAASSADDCPVVTASIAS